MFARAAADQLREFYRGQETEAGPAVVSVLNAHPEVSSFAARIEAAERLAQAVVEREQLREDLLRWLKRTPIIIAPVGVTSAFRHATKNVEVNGQSVSIFRAFSYARSFNVFGLPAVTVPVSRSAEGLPIGVQIVAGPGEEEQALTVAEMIEGAI